MAASNNQMKDISLMFLLGISVGVLFAVINTSLYKGRSIFNYGCQSPYMHEDPNLIPNEEKDLESVDENLDMTFKDLEDEHNKGGDKVAKELSKTVTVLCWVMTNRDNLRTRGKSIKETWGKRCNKLIFFTTEKDYEFPVVALKLRNGKTDAWSKTREAWKYIYNHHRNDADWFLAVDDETFVIVENLRLLLSKYDTNKAYYLGRWFTVEGGYNSEGAGYVFSKKTLKGFVRVMKDSNKCSDVSLGEEGNVGKCLKSIGIHPSDTRDSMKRETFHPLNPENHIVPGSIKDDHWIHGHNRFPVLSGADFCSDNSITFHYIRADYMYILEYLVYHLRPYGIQNSFKLPKKFLSKPGKV